jgi:hypothetical protein
MAFSSAAEISWTSSSETSLARPGFPVELGEGQVGLQEDFLGHVVGRFPVPDETHRHAEHL